MSCSESRATCLFLLGLVAALLAPSVRCTVPPGVRYDAGQQVCGNGVVESPERCDDGNIEDGDDCPADCGMGPLVCGDGIVAYGEPCDDGNEDNWDGCTLDCQEAEIRVNGLLPDDQEYPDVAMAPDGRFVVVWNVRIAEHKYAKVFDRVGTPQTGDIQVTQEPPLSYDGPDTRVYMQGNGDFSVIWERNRLGIGYEILKRDYLASGEPKGEEWAFHLCDGCTVYGPEIAGTPDGLHVVAWYNVGSDPLKQILLQRFHADGSLDGSPIQVAGDVNHFNAESIQLSMSTEGEHVVAWNDIITDTWFQLWSRRFDAYSEPIGPKVRLDEIHPQREHMMCALNDLGLSDAGSFVVTWGEGVGSVEWRCLFSLYDGQNEVIAQRQPCYPGGDTDTHNGRIAMLPDGRFALSWVHEAESEGPDGQTMYRGNYILWRDELGNPIGEPFNMSHYINHYDFGLISTSYHIVTTLEGPLVATFQEEYCPQDNPMGLDLPPDTVCGRDVYARIFPW